MSASYLLNGDPANLKINPIFLQNADGVSLNSVLKAGNDAEGLGMLNVSSITADASIGTQQAQYYPAFVINSGTDIVPPVDAPTIDNAQLIGIHGFNNDTGFRNIAKFTALNKEMFCIAGLPDDDVLYYGGEDGVYSYEIGTDTLTKICSTYDEDGTTTANVWTISVLQDPATNFPVIFIGGDFKKVVWLNSGVIQESPFINMALNVTAQEGQPSFKLINTTNFLTPASTIYCSQPYISTPPSANDDGFWFGGISLAPHQGLGYISVFNAFEATLPAPLTAYPNCISPNTDEIIVMQKLDASNYLIGGTFQGASPQAGGALGLVLKLQVQAIINDPLGIPTLTATAVVTSFGGSAGAHYLTSQTGNGNVTGLTLTQGATPYVVATGGSAWAVQGVGNLTDSVAYIKADLTGDWTTINVSPVSPSGYDYSGLGYNGTKVFFSAQNAVTAYLWDSATPATAVTNITAQGQGQTNSAYAYYEYSPYITYTANSSSVLSAGKGAQKYVFSQGQTFILSAKDGAHIFFVPKGYGTPATATADTYNTITCPDYGTAFTMIGDTQNGGIWRMLSANNVALVNPSNV